MSVRQPSEKVILSALNVVVQDMRQSEVNSTRNSDNFDHNTSSLREIDAEIDCLLIAAAAYQRVVERQIAKCRRRRNLLVSRILQYPDEIISEIFLHFFLQSSSNHCYRELRNLQLVCDRFYRISEATPRLWTQITHISGSPRDFLSRATILLEKSKNAPLHISLSLSANRADSFPQLDVVFPHWARWRTFTCVYSRYFPRTMELVESSLDCYARSKAPLLSEFTIKVSGRRYHPKQLNLFAGYAPCLQRLDIPHITISWDSPILSRLTFLRISAWDGLRAPTSEQYLQVLLSCPELEELHLKGRDVDCVGGGLAANFRHPISLPKLRKLWLKNLHPVAVQSLLSSITADPGEFSIIFPSNLSDQWRTVLETTLLYPPCQNLLSRFRSLAKKVSFTYWGNDPDANKHAIESSDAGALHQLTCAFKNILNPTLLYRTLFTPSLRITIQTLVINISHTHFSGDLTPFHLFVELVELTELQLTSYEISPWLMLAPLSHPISSLHTSPPRRTWLCPKLNTLIFNSINFGLRDLWKFLADRYTAGGPWITAPSALLHLEFIENTTYDDNMDGLSKVFALKIADLVGRDRFVWEGNRLNSEGHWIASL